MLHVHFQFVQFLKSTSEGRKVADASEEPHYLILSLGPLTAETSVVVVGDDGAREKAALASSRMVREDSDIELLYDRFRQVRVGLRGWSGLDSIVSCEKFFNLTQSRQ